MPSKKKPAATLSIISKEFIDQMVSGPMSAEAINAASMAFKKALIERALGAELSHHLGDPPGADKPADAAMAELEAFAQGPWGETFPTVAAAWRRAWDRVIPFLPSGRPYAG